MTIVTVHSAITGRPVPGASFDTDSDTFQSVISKALSFPEVRAADWDDCLAGQDAIEAVFTGEYPFSGDIRDVRFRKYGISHVTVTPSAAPEAPEAPEDDAEAMTENADTPVYSETLAAQSNVTPEAREFLATLFLPTLTPAPVKSTPEDFKPSKLDRVKTWAVPVAAFVAGVVAGGIIF